MQAVTVAQRIEAENAVQVLAGLREAVAAAGPTPLTLDLSALKEFDSSALSLLLQLARQCTAGGSDAAAGQPPLLLNPPKKLQKLAELYGVAELLFPAPAGRSGQAAPD